MPTSLWFYRCTFGAPPTLTGAHVLGCLSFVDCALPGLRAEGCRIDAELALRAGAPWQARSISAVRASALTWICAAVSNPSARCASPARGSAAICASGARMTADLDEAGVRGVALNLDRARIGGNVALDAGFSAAGTVRLVRARIGGDLGHADRRRR